MSGRDYMPPLTIEELAGIPQDEIDRKYGNNRTFEGGPDGIEYRTGTAKPKGATDMAPKPSVEDFWRDLRRCVDFDLVTLVEVQEFSGASEEQVKRWYDKEGAPMPEERRKVTQWLATKG